MQLNRVALLGGLVGLFVTLTGSWITWRVNRLAPGSAYLVSNWMDTYSIFVFALVWPTLATLLAWLPLRVRAWLLGPCGLLWLLTTPCLLGYAATLMKGGFSRASIGTAGWLSMLGALVVLFAALVDLERVRARRVWHQFTVVLGVIVLVLPFAAGLMNDLSIVREYAVQSESFRTELGHHLLLSAAALLLAFIFGLPLGIQSSTNKQLGSLIISFTSLLQVIPAVALLGLLIAPLSALSQALPFLGELGVRGIGVTPALIALTLYALLPVVRGTALGLGHVSASALEAGRGMGMNDRELFLRVALPLALPIILAGMRTAAVQLVGLTALASLIGAGGLGTFIFSGLGGAANDLVLLGALPVLLLSVITDTFWRSLGTRLVSKGLQA